MAEGSDMKEYSGTVKLTAVQALMHGSGELIFKSGDKYTGGFVDDLMEGSGQYIFTNGETYTGDFMNGTYHGAGKLQKGENIREGYWVNGKFAGETKKEYIDELKQFQEDQENEENQEDEDDNLDHTKIDMEDVKKLYFNQLQQIYLQDQINMEMLKAGEELLKQEKSKWNVHEFREK